MTRASPVWVIVASDDVPEKRAFAKSPTTAAPRAGATARACQLCVQPASSLGWQSAQAALPM